MVFLKELPYPYVLSKVVVTCACPAGKRYIVHTNYPHHMERHYPFHPSQPVGPEIITCIPLIHTATPLSLWS
jgi:hypothetical protein